MTNLMEYSSNLTYRYNDPLVINMPEVKQSLQTRLFPRGTPVFHRKHDVMLLDAVGASMYSSITSYHVDLGSLEPMKAFSSPSKYYYASMRAKETLLNLTIADAIQKELNQQKQPGGILNKYGVT